jgi:hypothetical protein
MTSVFGMYDIVPKKGTIYARLDWLSGNNEVASDTGVPGVDGIDYLPIDPRFDFTFLVTGFEWYLHPSLRVGPNIEWSSTAAARPASASTTWCCARRSTGAGESVALPAGASHCDS